jgi:hypothetical protein
MGLNTKIRLGVVETNSTSAKKGPRKRWVPGGQRTPSVSGSDWLVSRSRVSEANCPNLLKMFAEFAPTACITAARLRSAFAGRAAPGRHPTLNNYPAANHRAARLAPPHACTKRSANILVDGSRYVVRRKTFASPDADPPRRSLLFLGERPQGGPDQALLAAREAGRYENPFSGSRPVLACSTNRLRKK